MLFNSLDFAIFLPIVFGLYWFVFQKNIRWQNAFVLVASYVFYGWWDWRFLFLIVLSSGVDYTVGLRMGNTQDDRHRKILLWVSILTNVGLLGFFKYYNFFAENFAHAFTLLGKEFEPSRLQIILPVGISFYTFQTMSYTIDIYRKKLQPTHDPLAFFAFVSFFPQLVAGPIERASHLLPQFLKERKFEYSKAADGLRQILWGLFKKMVIADTCAIYVENVFANHAQMPGNPLFWAFPLFAIQFYCDFSGYSDIAIGTGRLFGFSLSRNFGYPFFARSFAEFWQRWHISLTTWCRDYIYIPLRKNARKNQSNVHLFTIITFAIMGFWHGAKWTFLLWGALMGTCLSLNSILLKKRKKWRWMQKISSKTPSWVSVLLVFFTFSTSGVLFGAEDIHQTGAFLQSLFTSSLWVATEMPSPVLFGFVSILFIAEWMQKDKQHALAFTSFKIPLYLRYAIYGGLVYAIEMFGMNQREFIYFQF